MNLLLLRPEELDDTGGVTLTDRRAAHLIEVLQVTPGSVVRTGLLNGPAGQAEVVEVRVGSVRLRCTFEVPAADPATDVLLLGMPRPKVLARCLEHAASLGFGQIVVFRSRRVVKSHFESHLLLPEHIHARLLAGLEQARRTQLPSVQVFPRFRPFVEDTLPSLVTPTNRYLADPDAAIPLHQSNIANAPFTLVIGPEGGLIPYEVEAFAQQGFQVVNAGPHPLRVEAALSFITGQVTLLRAMAEPSAPAD